MSQLLHALHIFVFCLKNIRVSFWVEEDFGGFKGYFLWLMFLG
jgi:hypothetical protein